MDAYREGNLKYTAGKKQERLRLKQDGRKETTLKSCLLASTHELWHKCTHTHILSQTYYMHIHPILLLNKY